MALSAASIMSVMRVHTFGARRRESNNSVGDDTEAGSIDMLNRARMRSYVRIHLNTVPYVRNSLQSMDVVLYPEAPFLSRYLT